MDIKKTLKGQSLPMNTIVIAILVIIVLLIIVVFFIAKTNSNNDAINKVDPTTCSKDNPILSTYKDVQTCEDGSVPENYEKLLTIKNCCVQK